MLERTQPKQRNEAKSLPLNCLSLRRGLQFASSSAAALSCPGVEEHSEIRNPRLCKHGPFVQGTQQSWKQTSFLAPGNFSGLFRGVSLYLRDGHILPRLSWIVNPWVQAGKSDRTLSKSLLPTKHMDRQD